MADLTSDELIAKIDALEASRQELMSAYARKPYSEMSESERDIINEAVWFNQQHTKEAKELQELFDDLDAEFYNAKIQEDLAHLAKAAPSDIAEFDSEVSVDHVAPTRLEDWEAKIKEQWAVPVQDTITDIPTEIPWPTSHEASSPEGPSGQPALGPDPEDFHSDFDFGFDAPEQHITKEPSEGGFDTPGTASTGNDKVMDAIRELQRDVQEIKDILTKDEPKEGGLRKDGTFTPTLVQPGQRRQRTGPEHPTMSVNRILQPMRG